VEITERGELMDPIVIVMYTFATAFVAQFLLLRQLRLSIADLRARIAALEANAKTGDKAR
jgi:hypothetical protein